MAEEAHGTRTLEMVVHERSPAACVGRARACGQRKCGLQHTVRGIVNDGALRARASRAQSQAPCGSTPRAPLRTGSRDGPAGAKGSYGPAGKLSMEEGSQPFEFG
jgi:hypothetical protein